MARRLLCDMFDIPVFKDLLKDKIETKFKELSVSYTSYMEMIKTTASNSKLK